MIEKNIGNIDRIFRLVFGLGFGGWVAIQPQINGVEWFVLIVAMMLMLNGVFSRCYLWYVLDVDTRKQNSGELAQQASPCR